MGQRPGETVYSILKGASLSKGTVKPVGTDAPQGVMLVGVTGNNQIALPLGDGEGHIIFGSYKAGTPFLAKIIGTGPPTGNYAKLLPFDSSGNAITDEIWEIDSIAVIIGVQGGANDENIQLDITDGTSYLPRFPQGGIEITAHNTNVHPIFPNYWDTANSWIMNSGPGPIKSTHHIYPAVDLTNLDALDQWTVLAHGRVIQSGVNQ